MVYQLPVGKKFSQSLLLIHRTHSGYERTTLLPVAFVPMTGEAEERQSFGKLDAGRLDFAVGEQPDQRLVGQVPHLDAVAPRIAEVAAEVRLQLQPVLLGELLPHLVDLRLVAHHDAEVLHAVRAELLHLEDGHELVLAQLAPGRALAASEHLEIEHVGIKRHGLLGVVHLDGDVVAPVDLHSHTDSPRVESVPSSHAGPPASPAIITDDTDRKSRRKVYNGVTP